MRCLHINIRRATFIVLSIVINNITITQMADNKMEVSRKDQAKKNHSTSEEAFSPKPSAVPQTDKILRCPSDLQCKDLNFPCIDCEYKVDCIYGQERNVTCRAKPVVKCKGREPFERLMACRYCYQTDHWEHSCDLKANCNSVASPRAHYATNCTVRNDVLCLGHRTFNKNVRCHWTGGYRWTTALVLSITLGGFGADRFYLGHWQEGIGKLFSFGGLGVWTIIDVVLISLHYLGPADGSLYI